LTVLLLLMALVLQRPFAKDHRFLLV